MPILPVQESSPDYPLPDKLKICKPVAPPSELPRHARDPGPTRHPRPPDSQFLAPFRLRHPNPHPVADVGNSAQSRASHSRVGIPVFQIFECAKVKFDEIAVAISEKPRAEPRAGRFISDISAWVSVGSGSVRVRVRFGWTKPLTTLGFKKVDTQNNGNIRIAEFTQFRDRLGWRLDRENAKIMPLPFFNLLANKPSVTLTHNPLVGGSSPPGPTMFIKFNGLSL